MSEEKNLNKSMPAYALGDPSREQMILAGRALLGQLGDSLTLESKPRMKLTEGGITSGGAKLNDIVGTLQDRGSNYGRFVDQAKYVQGLKEVLHGSPNWGTMAHDQKEALEMIVHKISRIVNGNPNYADSWHDIIGYAKLVEDRLNGIIR